MLKQTEGSAAVAEAIALCRPEVICCYPITPQTHIVENLSSRVRRGEMGPCQFINAESEFGALSILIGASSAGARTYTATASQGLLFMAEAVYNASGLGLPIVMTIGNRAIGAPINIWNDHSDSMSMRDAGWIQLFAGDNQEAVDLHIQAFRLAEELSCPVMVCMDGYILTHAIRTGRHPDAGPGRRLSAAVRAAAGARPVGPGVDRRDGRAGGLHRGPLPRAPQAASRAVADPAAVAGLREAVRPRLGRADPALSRGGRGDDRRRARLGQRNRPGSGRRDARRRHEDRLGFDLLVPAVPAARAARGAAAREARRRAGEVHRGGPGRHRLRWRAEVAVGHPAQGLHGHRRPRRPRDHARLVAAVVHGRRRGRARAGDLPRPQRRRRRPRARARGARAAHAARPPRRSSGASAPSARRSAEDQHEDPFPIATSGDRRCSRSSSTRPARSPSATGCSPRTSARCRRTWSARTRSTPGTAPARAAARRSARATRSTRRCARRRTR